MAENITFNHSKRFMKSGNKYSRRKFIGTTGLGAMSVLAGAPLLSSCGAKEKAKEEVVQAAVKEPIHTISCQMYTFRKEMAEDLGGTIERIAGTGLKNVETFDFSDALADSFMGAGKTRPADVAGMLKANGLSVSSMHAELPQGDQKEKILEMAEAYGSNRVIWHGWPEDPRYQSEDGIKELAEVYNESNEFLKLNGLTFGLHNHWWELRPDGNGGYPLQTLMNYIDKDIFLEIDTYWVKTAQQDPAEIIRKYGKRVQLMHIKDGQAPWKEDLASQPHDPMVPLGKGVMDFRAITEACGDDPKWYVIELDESAIDVFQAVKESVDYLQSNNMAKV